MTTSASGAEAQIIVEEAVEVKVIVEAVVVSAGE